MSLLDSLNFNISDYILTPVSLSVTEPTPLLKLLNSHLLDLGWFHSSLVELLYIYHLYIHSKQLCSACAETVFCFWHPLIFLPSPVTTILCPHSVYFHSLLSFSLGVSLVAVAFINRSRQIWVLQILLAVCLDYSHYSNCCHILCMSLNSNTKNSYT